jgi:cupin fold WbuC family metalloprotein
MAQRGQRAGSLLKADVQIISQSLLNAVSETAKASARQRKNFNFHLHDQDICHRLLNALEPDTYIPPHRHLHPAKAESIVILRGKIGVLFFDAEGRFEQHHILQPAGEVFGVNISPGVYHSVVALVPGSVFFEAKAGPYVPATADERADWAPAENSAGAAEYLAKMKKLFV